KLNESINIQHEQILQASRALNFCLTNDEFRGSIEEVDAHKVLRTAIERRKACQEEYERVIKCRTKRQPINNNMDEPRATLTFSYMSLSLKRDFVNDRINSLGEHVYYFMCLIKYREQVLSTQIVDSDAAIRVSGRVEFTNYINLKDVTHDFDVEISVFALKMRREEMSREQKYHSNKTLTLRNKIRPLTKTSLGGPSTVMDSKFCLSGQLTINKSSVSRQKFALQGYQSNVPIEPVIQLKMRCSAETSGNVEERGFLNLFENVTGLAAWRRFWCLLKDGSLRFWFYPDEETTKMPAYAIDLSRCRTKFVEPVSLEICTRPNTFLLEMLDEKVHSDRENREKTRNFSQ
uniref:Anillin homology domain-containing protein n=1 Tax=Romanomermis culicivorax TaxID=13658 RepID=A0A915KEE4_ROMCU